MNKERVLYTILGGTVGGVIGYFVGDVIAYKMLEKAFVEEFNELPDVFLNEPAEPEKVETINDKILYNQISKKEDLKDLAKPYEDAVAPYPFIINPEQARLDATFERYCWRVVSFYTEDSVFADEDENKIDDPKSRFGANIHLHFGEDNDDPDIVYVVNPVLEDVYEIIKIEESYSVQVLGEPLKPEKKAPVRRRKPPVKKITTKEDDTITNESVDPEKG